MRGQRKESMVHTVCACTKFLWEPAYMYIPLGTCILRYTKITVNFCLPAERLRMRKQCVPGSFFSTHARQPGNDANIWPAFPCTFKAPNLPVQCCTRTQFVKVWISDMFTQTICSNIYIPLTYMYVNEICKFHFCTMIRDSPCVEIEDNAIT